MMFIYKITHVKVCISIRKYNNVTGCANDAAACTPCLQPHRKIILTAILLKISQINLKIMYNQKIEK